MHISLSFLIRNTSLVQMTWRIWVT